MSLELLLEDIITKESEKLISRYHYYHNTLEIEHRRNKKRFGNSYKKKTIEKPSYWGIDKKFNPFYTRKKLKLLPNLLQIKLKIKLIPLMIHILKKFLKSQQDLGMYQYFKSQILQYQSYTIFDC